MAQSRIGPSDHLPPLMNGPPFPVSDSCPHCGGEPDRLLRARPWIWIGLWKDRACSRCLLGFRPHQPLWAKACYIGSLFTLMVLLAVALVVVVVPNWTPNWVETVWLPAAFLAAHVLGLVLQMRR